MSKNFEQAYRESAQIEAPDLWDRIEAGLKDKSAPGEERGKVTFKEEGIQEKPDGEKKKLFIFKKYSGVIAAAVCVAMILPAVVFLRHSSKGYSAADVTESAGEMDNAAESAEGFDDTAESIEETADAGALDMAPMEAEAGAGMEAAMPMDADDGTMNEKYAVSQSADAGAAADNGAPDSLADTTAVKEEAMEENERESASKVMEDMEGNVFEHVLIKVTEVKEDFYKEGEKEPGALCTASLQQELSSIPKGEQVMIYIPASLQNSFYRDGLFEVDLKYHNGEEYSFVLMKSYQ